MSPRCVSGCKVLSAAQRSAHLVHQLLQLARSESNVPMQPLDLPQLACEVAANGPPRPWLRALTWGMKAREQLRVLGRPLLLREALNNLIDNALHYAGTGATVTVRVHHRPWHGCAGVEDDGPGCPQSIWATCSRGSGRVRQGRRLRPGLVHRGRDCPAPCWANLCRARSTPRLARGDLAASPAALRTCQRLAETLLRWPESAFRV